MKKERNKGFVERKIDSLIGKFGQVFTRSMSFLRSSATNLIFFIAEIREKSKNLLKTNLDLADHHLQNSNFFDAEMRYKIALRIDNTNFEALFGLAFINFRKDKFEKANYFLNQSLKYARTESERSDINKMLSKVKEKL